MCPGWSRLRRFYDHDWLLPVIEPLLPDVSVRMAAGLVSALQDPQRQKTIRAMRCVESWQRSGGSRSPR